MLSQRQHGCYPWSYDDDDDLPLTCVLQKSTLDSIADSVENIKIYIIF